MLGLTSTRKAILCVFLSMLIFFCFSFMVYGRTHIWIKIGHHKATVNESKFELEVAPFLKNQRTLVPLRFIAEVFGASVEWMPNEKVIGEGMIIISFYHQYKRIKMHTRVPIVYIETHINDLANLSVETYIMDVEPFIVKPQNRTVVPLRFIAETMDASVQWNPNDQSIDIYYDA